LEIITSPGWPVKCFYACAYEKTYERKQLFHIFQELLFTIRKYAAATQVNVGLSENGEAFTLTIADNGKGFVTAESLRQKKSFGYKLLEQDIQSIGADLKLTNIPAAGT